MYILSDKQLYHCHNKFYFVQLQIYCIRYTILVLHFNLDWVFVKMTHITRNPSVNTLEKEIYQKLTYIFVYLSLHSTAKMIIEQVNMVKFLLNINSVRDCLSIFENKSTSKLVIYVEKPAIDRLLDYISNKESQKPAIDLLIEEYLERIGSPLTQQSSHISPLVDISMY